MKRAGIIGLSILLVLLANFTTRGQILEPAKWAYGQSEESVEVGQEVDLIFNARIDKNWYLYSSDFDPDLGPMVTEFHFEPNETFELVGGIKPINPKKAYDEIFEGDYTYFKGKGQFRQTIKVKSSDFNFDGYYSYQVCSDIDGKCIPFDEDFSSADFAINVSAPVLLEAESAEVEPVDIGSSEPTGIVLDDSAQSGILQPAEWQVSFSTADFGAGDEIEVVFTATIDPNWYLYSSDFDPDLGPIVAEFHFESNDSYELIGGIEAIDPSKAYDEIFEGDYTYFKGTGEFRQKIKILKTEAGISGYYTYQVCSDIDGKCITFDEDFQLGEVPVTEVSTAGPSTSTSGNENPEDKSILGFMIFAFLSGLVALLTPCVFPMIPMTVTFFLKDNESGKKASGIRKALIFGISIIFIFTVIGLLVAVLFGAETLNDMATHWIPNVFVFLIFMVFAASFLGMFDLTLPHSWVNKMDQKAEGGGLGGVFFMAATLALVSFSCTFPIVGSVLVLSTQGEFIKPVFGMLAFSMAFALPFTLFAAFPEWLKGLPKSGGWLNSVKVVLGFLELALGLKFLSVADQAYHWGLLDREVYLALWIVIFTLLAFYLLGKIRLPHDSKVESVGVPRLMLSIAVFSFVVYLIPGLWGAPLKALAGYLPPMSTHDFNVVEILDRNASRSGNVADLRRNDLCEEPKYSDLLHFPHGIDGYFDFDQAMACSRAQNKPLFIDFTGHGCVNCREMEARVWSDQKVLQRLKNDFVVVAMYVDDKTKLPESEWYTSPYDNKVKKTIGKQNADFQITRYQNNAQPFYVILDQNEEMLVSPLAYDLSISNFVDYLERAKTEFENRRVVARK